MNKGLAFVLGCIFGGAGGGFLAHTVLKQKYAQKADEEIIACREAFQNELVKLRKEANEKEAEEKKAAADAALKAYRGESDVKPPFEVETKKSEPEPQHVVIDETDYNDPANPNKKKCLQFFPNDNVILQRMELLWIRLPLKLRLVSKPSHVSMMRMLIACGSITSLCRLTTKSPRLA